MSTTKIKEETNIYISFNPIHRKMYRDGYNSVIPYYTPLFIGLDKNFIL